MDDADIADLRAEAEDNLRRRLADARARALAAQLPITHCTDCGEELSAVRQDFRAERCVDCQIEFDRLRALQARLGGRHG